MPNDLLAEFNAGRSAFHGDQYDCPYLATSNSADAWHAGWEYERKRPSTYLVDKVWHGRGYRVNVREGIGHPKPSLAPRHVYCVDWDYVWPVVTMEF
jgi:hypothetical protein